MPLATRYGLYIPLFHHKLKLVRYDTDGSTSQARRASQYSRQGWTQHLEMIGKSSYHWRRLVACEQIILSDGGKSAAAG
jgi:hypothetical protein